MTGKKLTRRKAITAVGGTAAALTSTTVFTGMSSAWNKVPISLQCTSCTRLGKVEAIYAEDDSIERWKVEDSWGVPGTAQDSKFTFDIDEDGTEETTIKLTDYYYYDGEKVGFDLVSDVGLCRVDVKDGGDYENEYKDLGATVHGTEFFAPSNPSGGTDPGQLSNVQFYYCETPRACVLSSDVPFDPMKTIDVTDDEVRIAVWWGARHYSDSKLFDKGTKPTDRLTGDVDGDGTDDLCFEFNFTDAVVNDPVSVKDPEKMYISLLVEESDGDIATFVGKTQDGIVSLSPSHQ